MESWRQNLRYYLEFTDGLTDVYEFGVYTAKSMVEIDRLMKDRGIPVRKFFGLDSFEGLPEETAEPLGQEEWVKGGFNGQDHFGVNSVQDCVDKTRDFLKEYKVDSILIPGFYEQILNLDAVAKWDFKPALYVDLDVDLYSSTKTVLEFLIENEIVQPGTILGMDDWGGTPSWREWSSGQPRALQETIKKYGLVLDQLFQVGNQYPHVHTAFQIK